MGNLILEIPARPLHHYHPIGSRTVRVGRALDNDIILSDPTVSPHHMLLRELPDGALEIRNLSDENGTRVDRQPLTDPVVQCNPPARIELGRLTLRVLHRNQQAQATRLMPCKGGGICLYHSMPWFFFMLMATFAAMSSELYLDTYTVIEIATLVQTATAGLFAFLTVAAFFAIVNRLALNRWDFFSTLVLTSLLVLVSLGSEKVATASDYFFTSDIPGEIIEYLNLAFILPFVLYHYYVKINHASRGTAWLLISLLVVPALYVQGKATVEDYALGDKFTSSAKYNRSVYPVDIRLSQTMDIKTFIDKSRGALKK